MARVYDGPEVAALHPKYGVSNARVARDPQDANDVLVAHDFASCRTRRASPQTRPQGAMEPPASPALPGSRSSSLSEPLRRGAEEGGRQPAFLGVPWRGAGRRRLHRGVPGRRHLVDRALRDADPHRLGADRRDRPDRAGLPGDLNLQTSNTLAVIEGAAEPLTPSEISDRTLISSATMTSTLDRLERQGLVRRLPNPEDRRSVLVEVTEAGRDLCDRFLPGINALQIAVMSDLEPAERHQLLEPSRQGPYRSRAGRRRRADPLEGRRVRPTGRD